MAGDPDLGRPASRFLDGMTSVARVAVGKLCAFAARYLRRKWRARRSVAKAACEENRDRPAEYRLLKEFVTAYSGARPPRVLAFGDSVFLRIASEERLQESLVGMLGARLGDRIFVVSGSGYHAGMFERFSAVLATLPAHPSCVIMPVNLRSFSPTWDLNPLYQFRAETDVLSAFAAGNTDYGLQDGDADADAGNLSVEMVCGGGHSVTLGEFLDLARTQPVPESDAWAARLERIFRYHYACPLQRDNRKLRSLVKAVQTLNGLGAAVYCYVTPINYEAGAEYCGALFAAQVRHNISVLQHELTGATESCRDKFRLDDFAFEFGRHAFFTPHNSTEHLRLEGREFLIQTIVDVCRSVSADGVFERAVN